MSIHTILSQGQITVIPSEIPQPPTPSARRLHVAIISDGNGRWATSRGLPRSAGHRAGAETARAIIAAAPKMGIHTLTLFALSSANWKRPEPEVAAILRILHEYLLAETRHCIDEGIRLSIIGRRDRFSAHLRRTVVDSEDATARGTRLHLRLAVDYSARNAIYSAARRFYKSTELSEEAFADVMAEARGGAADVDLLIRTGGEQRISDFLLWESAFAEFFFIHKRWPDFTVDDLRSALEDFASRERTRGALPSSETDAIAG
ncbi:MAG: di-trans,poly-cis-decaprenylcistransferase [Acidobacteria bacterium]|nr:di-trans,poly-cis-decaprenylcistransferase [Acidobacteriota bacterium]